MAAMSMVQGGWFEGIAKVWG